MSTFLQAIIDASDGAIPDEFSEINLKMDAATGDVSGTVTPSDFESGEDGEPVKITITKQAILDAMGLEDGPAEDDGEPQPKADAKPADTAETK